MSKRKNPRGTRKQEALRAGYPIVRCECPDHPLEPGFVACGRVAKDGIRVGEVVPATSEKLGQILCADALHMHDASTVKDAVLVCASCAREKGWLAK